MKYNYVSFSKQLFSHAYRRPKKWSFGIAFKKDKIKERIASNSKYELAPRSHLYNSIKFAALFYTGNDPEKAEHYMAKIALYGFVEISKEIFSIILEAFKLKAFKEQANNSSLKWALEYWNVTDKTLAAANADLKKLGFTTKICFAGNVDSEQNFSVNRSNFTEEEWKKILDYLLNETYYNEGEERIWCKETGLDVKFTQEDIYGIIMPEYIADLWLDILLNTEYSEHTTGLPLSDDQKEAIRLSKEQTDALIFIWKYIDKYKLKLLTHNAMDGSHLKELDQLRSIKTSGNR